MLLLVEGDNRTVAVQALLGFGFARSTSYIPHAFPRRTKYKSFVSRMLRCERERKKERDKEREKERERERESSPGSEIVAATTATNYAILVYIRSESVSNRYRCNVSKHIGSELSTLQHF